MKNISVDQFLYGQIDTIPARALPRGTPQNILNWLCEGAKLELRRGYAVLGNKATGTGKVTTTIRIKMADGTERVYRTRGTKLEYYDASTDTWGEVGTDVLGTDADGDEVSFAGYHSLAGDQMFVNGVNGPFLKIMLANPTDYATIYDSTKNYKGYIKIKNNRMYLWGRKADKTGVYLSKIDTENYTTVSAENVGTGDGSETDFSDTLAFKAGGAKRTCFAIVATDGTETFSDNGDGTLTGDAGGTGTINYMTGAISVTFNAAPTNLQAITCDYQWEDVTSGGIADFTKSATRVAGEGAIFRQDDGGPLQNVLFYGAGVDYCIHEEKTWVLTLTADDTNATNFIYREKVGIPSKNAAVDTGEGIYVINRGDDKDYELQLIRYNTGNDKVEPRSISKQHIHKKKRVGINLSGYRFNKAFMWEWGDYILCACRTSDRTENNRMIVYDKKQKSIVITDFWATGMAEFSGTLIASDTHTDNVYTIWSGWDDDGSEIPNYVELNEDNLDFEGLKKCKKLKVHGLIVLDQKIKVSVKIDNGSFVEVGGSDDDDGNHTYAIQGDESYVDKGQRISVGTNTIGSREVGGGGSAVYGYRYVKEIPLNVGKFNLIVLRFQAMAIGFCSIEAPLIYKDIRLKSRKLPAKYVS